MFIRQTKTRNKASGEAYTTYRLVRSERVGGKVRQITLLNLGRNFSVSQSDWPVLCQRIEELVIGQTEMFEQAIPKKIEKHAQHYAAQLMARTPVRKSPLESSPQQDFQEVDIESLESLHPRTVGVEHVGLHAMKQLGFLDKLEELGIQNTIREAIVGSIIGRMASPGSELHTYRWLQNQSCVFRAMSITDSEGCRSLIPIHGDHSFRGKPITNSEPCRSSPVRVAGIGGA